MVRTSSIETPRSLAWVRSMISSSQGVLARKLVNRPCKLRVVLAGGDDLVGASSAGPAGRCRRVSWTMILKPPAVPRPSTGGARRCSRSPAALPSEVAPASRAAMASLDSVRRTRSLEIVEHQVQRAEVGGVGVEQDRLAGDGDGVLDARAFPGRCSSICWTTSWVRSTRGGVGQLDVDQQVALVLLRDEAGGRCRGSPSRSGPSRPP